MSLSVSPQVRLVALIGLLAALGLLVGTMVLGRGGGDSTAVRAIKPLHPVKKHVVAKAPAPKAAPAGRRATTPAKRAAAVKKHSGAGKRRAAQRPAAPKPAVAASGLPASVAAALAAHPVVVVSLYAPGASVDEEALKEAQAGAELAHAGFVTVNVLRQSESKPLVGLLGVLSDPAVVVFKRPNTVFVKLDGFADRETVAQAAANAAA